MKSKANQWVVEHNNSRLLEKQETFVNQSISGKRRTFPKK